MARYKHVDLSPRLLPVDLDAQLVPVSFAHALQHLVDSLDLSAFETRYRNNDIGAPAHSPSILLKAVLLVYSRGFISSCAIERACRDNALFIAITGDAKPHFTTIAHFVSRSRELREWLAANPGDRQGPSGGVCRSNLTDGESAKMATHNGCGG